MTTAIDDFDGRAVNYTAPGCFDLPVLRQLDSDGNRVCVSAWQFSPEQLTHINENGGIVYLAVWGGKQPPVFVTHENPYEGMGTVEEIKQLLLNTIAHAKTLSFELQNAIRANATPEKLKQIDADAQVLMQRAKDLSWVLNLK